MKVYIGPYRDRWVSYVHDKYMNKKYGWDWPEYGQKGLRITHEPFKEAFLRNLEDALQWIYNHTINLILDRRSGQKMKIRIDKYDTWSMDHTLAPIILPMLKQLKETKHGSPSVDMVDVPQELRVNDVESKQLWDRGELDDNHHARWAWVLNEMIWTFEQKNRDWWEEDYIIQEGEMGENIPVEHEGETFYEMTWKKPYIWDDEGWKAHQERMNNGFRLFGKYYEGLWN